MPSKTKEINEKNKKKTTAKKALSTNKKVTKKSSSKTTIALKSATNSASVNSKNSTVKKSKSPKPTANKSVSDKKGSVKKNNNSRALASSTQKTLTSKSTIKKSKAVIDVVEYYDLPYRYNETIVKILYQSPETLFVYWDIADSDRENYIKQYGENFFNITRPVLIVHNDTMNYSFEIPINDFANSWYLHINDSKCNYRVELGRRPNYYNQEVAKEIEENIKADYIYISSSNKIESPNNRVLFNTNENNTVKFRNVKNHQEKSFSLYDIVKSLPAIKNIQNIPYISKELLENLYSGIYQNEDISLFERLTNPSSGGNPSSGTMSSRFI